MTAPEAAGSVRAVPQPVAAPLTRAAIFLVVTVNPGSDNRATLRSFCGDLAALLRAVEFRDLEAGLSCVMGFGSDAWDRLLWPAAAGGAASVPRDSRRNAPRRLHAGRPAVPHPREAHGSVLRARDADHGAYRRCGFAGGRGARLPLLRRPRSPGFRRRNGESEGRGSDRRRAHRRGGRGVRRRQLRDRAEISPRSRRMERAVHGGAGTHHRPHEAVRHRIGRFRSSRPRRTTHSPRSSRTARRSRSCATTCRSAGPAQGEFGTYFIGYSRSPRTIEQMLENMFVGRPPGNYDRLLDFSRAVTGNLFFVPSATFLESVTEDEPAAAVLPAASDGGRTLTIHPVGARWFARHRLPQRRHPA